MNKHLLLTGGTGFIGGFLVKEAVDQGYQVYATVRKSSDTQYIKDIPNVKLIELDFDNINDIRQTLDKYDITYVLNNAGITRSKSEDKMNHVNADYVYNICEACKLTKNKINRFVHISSLAAFGPADFTKDGLVKESTTPHPVTMYGRSKLKGETILKNQNALPYVIIRPTAVYGPREKDLFTVFKMINQGIQTKVGIADQKLTFIYVKDLVVYMINALTSGQDNKGYFISDGNAYSSHTLNELIRTALNKRTLKLSIPLPIIKVLGFVSEHWGNLTNTYPPLNIDKVKEIKAKSWICDTAPNQDLGYTPKFQLKKGIEETVAWYKSNDWL